jgi:hypothetical protein
MIFQDKWSSDSNSWLPTTLCSNFIILDLWSLTRRQTHTQTYFTFFCPIFFPKTLLTFEGTIISFCLYKPIRKQVTLQVFVKSLLKPCFSCWTWLQWYFFRIWIVFWIFSEKLTEGNFPCCRVLHRVEFWNSIHLPLDWIVWTTTLYYRSGVYDWHTHRITC